MTYPPCPDQSGQSRQPLTAVIGGSGFADWPALEISGEDWPETAWGKPSAPLTFGSVDSAPLVFLPRHGRGHRIPPHRINYRANIQALKDAGVHRVIGINAVGGIHGDLTPGCLVIPDQLIDYTHGREMTFFDGSQAPVTHIEFGGPYDEFLRKQLLAAGQRVGVRVTDGGVYGATQGPRLETAAEIQRLARDGCDVVGMTGMPEAALARELALPYASLALVVNPAAGIGSEAITMEEINQVLNAGAGVVRQVIRGLLAGG